MADRYAPAPAALTFSDLVALLRGELPLPDNRCVAYSLPLCHAQASALVPLLQDGDGGQAPAVQRVRGLKLRGCALDDQGAEHMARVVAFNTSMRYLDLRDNAIGGVGAIHLANALRLYNFTLLDLDLTGNPALREDPDAVEEIAMLLHRNRQQQANSTPTSSPARGAALVRFQELAPDTPSGHTRLDAHDAEMELRLQALERAQEEAASQLAGLAEGAASHAEYRASLDVTSQKIALVLELLRSDVDAIKVHQSTLQEQASSALPADAAARLALQLDEVQAKLARVQQLHEDGSQRNAPLERVQALEERLAKMAAAGDAAAAATAQQLLLEVEELRSKACLAQADADKAGGEAQAVAACMKSVGESIRQLSAEQVAAAKLAAGAAAAVGPLEEQVRTLQLSVEAMEEALGDHSQQLEQGRSQAAAHAAEHAAAAAAASEQAAALQTGLKGVEAHQGRMAVTVAALVDAELADRATQLEAAVVRLESSVSQQAAAAAELAPLTAVDELRMGMAAALDERAGQLAAQQAEHAACVAAKLAALPAPYDDAALQGRVAAGEEGLQQARESLAAVRAEELPRLRSEAAAQVQELAGQHTATAARAAAMEAALGDLQQATVARHAALEGAAEEQQSATAERLAGLEAAVDSRLAAMEAAVAAVPVFDDASLRGELAAVRAAAQAERAELQLALSLLAPNKQVERWGREGEMRQAALADKLASLEGQLAALSAAQATADERFAAADAVEGVRADTGARLAEMAGQVAGLHEAQAAGSAAQQATANEVERLRRSICKAADGVQEAAVVSRKQQEALRKHAADAGQQAAQDSAALQQRLAAAEGTVHQAVQRLAAVETELSAQCDRSSAAGSPAPASALTELQLQCELLQLGAQESAARAAQELSSLRADFNQHRGAVLGQCSELQEGLEAVPDYGDRLAAAEARLHAAEQRLASAAAAADVQAEVAALRGDLTAQGASLAGHTLTLDAVDAAQRALAAKLQGEVHQLEGQLALTAPAEAVEQLRAAAVSEHKEVAGQLGELSAGLKAMRVLSGAQQEQLALLEAAAAQLAPAAALEKLREVMDGQHGAVASQLGGLLSALQAATDAHAEQLSEVQGGLKAAEGSAAAAHDAAAALRHAVAQAQQDAGKAITHSAAALLCQEAVRPAEERLTALAQQQDRTAASSAEAAAEVQLKLTALQGAFASICQEHAGLADTVGDMQGSAIAVAAAVADQGSRAEPLHLACRGATSSPVPRLQLGAMRAAGRSSVDGIASFPLSDRALFSDFDCGSEAGRGVPTEVATAAAVAVQARQYTRLEGVVVQQAERIHQLESELHTIKQLLVAGSPLVAGRRSGLAVTPGTQRFYDAQSVLNEPSPATARTPCHVAATPTVGLACQAASTGRRLAAGGAAALEAPEVLGASLERQFGAAAFGGDITNTSVSKQGGAVARKPAVAPAAHPAAYPASRSAV